MIQTQLKLKLTPRQERQLNHWLWHLTSVWNWAVRKIENDARDGVSYTAKTFHNLLAGHGKTLGIPSHVLQGMLGAAYVSWQRCFKKLARRPRLKGRRNKLISVYFPDPRFHLWSNNRVTLIGIGRVRYHKQDIPEGKIKCGRIIKRASGWYLCLFIAAEPNAIPRVASHQVGIDSGFTSLLTLSNGAKIAHPRELEASAFRLAQSQRGINRKQVARLHERIGNQRKDRNHKLSRRLVSENSLIAFSADNHKAISKRFGKSVASSGHGQLRRMLSYKAKCRTDGHVVYVEVDSKNSTRRCSACKALTGPTGLASLSVRQWKCPCGAEHDRDVNAAVNTLLSGLELAHETLAKAA